jgi:hypothetical protein
MAVGTVRQGTPPRDPGEPAPAAPQVTAPRPLVYVGDYLRDAGEHGVRHRRALPVAGVGRYRIAQAYKAWHASGPSASRGLEETSLTEHGVVAPDVLEEDS